jgi:hypothetical protein
MAVIGGSGPPSLVILGSGSSAALSWPSADTAAFALEQAGALANPTSWSTVAATATDDGTNRSVTLPATNGSQFFRLRGQQ